MKGASLDKQLLYFLFATATKLIIERESISIYNPSYFLKERNYERERISGESHQRD